MCACPVLLFSMSTQLKEANYSKMNSQELLTHSYHQERSICHGYCAPQEQRSKELSQTAASLRFRTKQPREEKDRPQAHYVFQLKGYQRRKRQPGHKQLRSSFRLDSNCQASTTPQGQHRQGTEPHISQPKAQNQVKPGTKKNRPKAHCPSTQRVLAQDEVVKPHASVATPQARWEWSHTVIQQQA